MDKFDVVGKSKHTCRFTWDDDKLPAVYNLQRANTVVMGYVRRRDHDDVNGVALLPHYIDYEWFIELTDPKFRSQRSCWSKFLDTTMLFYFSRKILSVGGDTSLVAVAGLYVAACILKHSQYEMVDGEPADEFILGGVNVVNGVVAGSLMRYVNMPFAAQQVLDVDEIRYEPDLFAGVVLMPRDGVADDQLGTITIFHTGEFIFAGVSTNARVKSAIARLRQLVEIPWVLLDDSTGAEDLPENAGVRKNTRGAGGRRVHAVVKTRRGGTRRANGRDIARKMATERQIAENGLGDLVRVVARGRGRD